MVFSASSLISNKSIIRLRPLYNMASNIALICFQIILMIIESNSLGKSSGSSDDLSILGDESLGDDDSSSTSDSEFKSKELKKYHKYLGKMEAKYYKEMFNKERSQEEQAQVNYYEGLLQKIKQLNKE